MITASIVTYKTDVPELRHVLDCLEQNGINRVYWVDNSPDDSLRVIADENRIVPVDYIHGHGNIGYGAAHNLAIRKALDQKADYHLVLNTDTSFDKDTVPALRLFMDGKPDAGLAMPLIRYPDGAVQYVCKLLPTPLDLIFKRFLPSSWTRRRMDRFQLKFTGYDKPMNVPFLSGCFMFFRLSAFRDVGLFDERFFMYGEDIDLSRRMHEKYRTLFYPAATVIHAHAAASKSSLRMLNIHIVNVSRYFSKWGWFFDRDRRKINKKALQELKGL